MQATVTEKYFLEERFAMSPTFHNVAYPGDFDLDAKVIR